MALNLDRMLYLVVCSDNGELYTPERYLAYMDRKTTVEYIATGQAPNFVSVIEFNPVEGICREVTEDIATEVMHRWDNDGEPLSPWRKDFVEQFISIRAANAFPRAA